MPPIGGAVFTVDPTAVDLPLGSAGAGGVALPTLSPFTLMTLVCPQADAGFSADCGPDLISVVPTRGIGAAGPGALGWARRVNNSISVCGGSGSGSGSSLGAALRCSVFFDDAVAVFSLLEELLDLLSLSSSSSSSALFFAGAFVAVLLVVAVFLLALVDVLALLEEDVVVVLVVVVVAGGGVDVLVTGAGAGAVLRDGADIVDWLERLLLLLLPLRA